MAFGSDHVRQAFEFIRKNGFGENKQSTKWDIIDPITEEPFPPKAVLRVAKELAKDTSPSGGGGWPTNDPLRALGFVIALKAQLDSSREFDQIKAIFDSKVSATIKKQLVNARLGQGSFRAALFEVWNGRCAVSGCSIEAVLRASHIKAWRHSDDRERLDPNNGILLAASIDGLFDGYLIAFTPQGTMLLDKHLTQETISNLGVPAGARLNVRRRMQPYLDSHRAEFEQRQQA